MTTATYRGLSEEQLDRLNTAIDRARRPGSCQYAHGGKPCCVIGQLAALEGASVSTLERWDGCMSFNGGGLDASDIVTLIEEEVADDFGYPSQLLNDLQGVWDCEEGLTDDETREEMRKIVANWTAGRATP